MSRAMRRRIAAFLTILAGIAMPAAAHSEEGGGSVCNSVCTTGPKGDHKTECCWSTSGTYLGCSSEASVCADQ